MIELSRVTKRYAGSRQAAVDNLNLEVAAGEIFGFLGPNGAGKTTTIKMICGLLQPDGGTVRVAGADMLRDPLAAKRRIGYVPDSPDLYEQLSGQEYLNFVADVYRVDLPERKQRVGELAGELGLTEALPDRVAGYSHGMRQKLSVIASLLHRPPVWILDEPLVGLDPQSARTLKNRMQDHAAAGGSVFFSSHILEVVERLCHRVGIIKEGRLIACGPLDDLRQGRDLESTFLELTGA